MNSTHLHVNSWNLPACFEVAESGPGADKEFFPMLAKTLNRVADYLAAIDRIAPVVAEHRAAFDRDRRLPDAVFAALADARLFRLWLPETLGGPELSPSEFMMVVEAASALDGSVGWLVGNGGGMSRIAGYLPEAIVREWFANPHAFVASATGAVAAAQKVPGGYHVTGRWPFGSGAHHATFFMGLASVKGADGREEAALCCYFDRKDVVIHDTWSVSGLRGTGSCDFEVRELFVPEQHTHVFVGHPATQPGAIYRLPALSVFAWTVSVVPLGIARGALNAFSALASRKTRLGTSSLLRDRETIQSMIGRMEALHGAARAFLVQTMNDLLAAREGTHLLQARATFRAACTHAAESAVRIVDTLAAELGAASIFESCPLERAVRDLHAAVKHIAMSPNNYIVPGRLALGLDAGTSRF
jgi:alkylation response protein AidB-like acyl-CoA dehydrogenase